MKKITILLVILLGISCGHNIDKDSLIHLNGYWEIKEAIMPDGSEKEYTVNPVIDFFELKDNKGVRKKVMPQFDGSYKMNGLSEKINIVEEGGKTFIAYTTEYAEWKEQILKLDDEHLVLKNEQDMEYHYKKPQPFSIE